MHGPEIAAVTIIYIAVAIGVLVIVIGAIIVHVHPGVNNRRRR